MIALVEGAERRKTPNEIALNILLAGLTITFLAAVVTLRPFAIYAGTPHLADGPDRAARRADPDDDRRAAVGDRHRRDGPDGAAQRARDVRPRGRGSRATSTCSCSTRPARSRSATGRRPSSCRWTASPSELAEAAQLSSLADETPEGRSIVVLAKERYGLRGRELGEHEATFIPFSATTRMSGVDFDGKQLRKGAADAVKRFVEEQGGHVPRASTRRSTRSPAPAARRSSSPRTTSCSASST